MSAFFVAAVLFLSTVQSFAGNAEGPPNGITIKTRIPELKTFPCTKCHKSFKLGTIDLIKPTEHKGMEFHHMPEVQECRLCHSYKSPNMLNLMDGTLVSYDDMYRVCGQCHGKIEFEWQRGFHGKAVGYWNGPRTKMTCAECHNPHAPKFAPMEAVFTPTATEHIIRKGEHK